MSAELMIVDSQEFHGDDELYWYPGTSLMSLNRRFGCDAAEDEIIIFIPNMIVISRYFFVKLPNIMDEMFFMVFDVR